MSEHSQIEWTHDTFNPWVGCARVSPACERCYAERLARRYHWGSWGISGDRKLQSDSYWAKPLQWNAAARLSGGMRRVFCASMADVFEDRRDLDAERTRLWGLIERTPDLTWLLLTKRIHRVQALAPWQQHWPANVWIGCTAEDQRRVDERLPHLIQIPAAVRFISIEPQVSPVDLARFIDGIDWVIAGGESGPGARATPERWFADVRDQCTATHTAFFFKQWGNNCPDQDGSLVRLRSKKHAHRLLEGREWNEFPVPRLERQSPSPLDRG